MTINEIARSVYDHLAAKRLTTLEAYEGLSYLVALLARTLQLSEDDHSKISAAAYSDARRIALQDAN
jgi:hypothetical protein